MTGWLQGTAQLVLDGELFEVLPIRYRPQGSHAYILETNVQFAPAVIPAKEAIVEILDDRHIPVAYSATPRQIGKGDTVLVAVANAIILK